MNFRKLITYLTMGTAAAMPLAVAQNPTILQGNYISNVFGNSNFIKNPNAQTNIADVTVSNATVTRSTTTPLVATSEFLITTSTATGSATWSTRTFDAGMKGQNCEARFTYRGFSVGSTTAQILQGANVVAQLTLTASTDPRIASINFPCGDLSSATTFRLQQATASLTGTNEIGGIYVGLATNMANVAQAEFIGSLSWPANGTSDTRTGTAWQAFQTLGSVDPTIIGNVTSPNRAPRITVPNLKAGNYRIIYTGSFGAYSSTDVDIACFFRITDGAASPTVFGTAQTVRSYGAISSNNGVWTPVLAFDFQYTGATQSMTFFLEASANSAVGNCRVETYTNAGLKIAVYRFPSSSELVVTPERQNVFGGVVYTAENQTLFGGTAAPTAYSSYNNATWNKPAKLVGKAQVTTTNSGNDLGFSIPNMPVGSYKVEISGLLNANNSGSTQTPSITRCNFRVVETDSSGTLRTEIARQVHQDMSVIISATEETRDYTNAFYGIYNNTSVTTRNFRLEAQKFGDDTTGSVGGCQAFSGTGTNSYNSNIAFLLTPLDQPSNSALYVQGPVLGAQTGAAIPSGYQGETFSELGTTDLTINTTSGGTSTTLLTKTIPAGVWMLIPAMHCKENSGMTGEVRAGMKITTSNTDTWSISSSVTDGQVGLTIFNPSTTVGMEFSQDVSGIPLFVNLTSATTYYMRGTTYNNTNTGSVICRAVLKGVRLN